MQARAAYCHVAYAVSMRQLRLLASVFLMFSCEIIDLFPGHSHRFRDIHCDGSTHSISGASTVRRVPIQFSPESYCRVRGE